MKGDRNDEKISLRVPADVVKRARVLADKMTSSNRGFAYSESDVLRAGLVRGLEDLEREHGKARK